MLTKSDISIDVVISEFSKFGVEAGYFVPTETGMTKSIVDAYEGLRRFFKSKGIHDFELQPQGPDHKKQIQVHFVNRFMTNETVLSLYRPDSKKGDPRFWVSRLGTFARAHNVIAFIVTADDSIYLVNCSDKNVWASRNELGSELNRILVNASKSEIADELLSKLRTISNLGFIDSQRQGPTGIGFTLETLLGIPANSSRNPDYKGIELKSGRARKQGKGGTRSTMFSQVPNWDISDLKSGREILQAYGYVNTEKNRRQLYCSISNTPNSQGLFMRLSQSGDLVESLAVSPNGNDIGVVAWSLSELENALAAKHQETFWVKAQQRQTKGVEQFHFTDVIHTRRPLINNFGFLVETGKIEVDFTLSSKPSGGSRDHGYLFKMWSKNFDLIFPAPVNYVLAI